MKPLTAPTPDVFFTVAKAIRTRVPQKLTLAQLGATLGLSIPRLEAILDRSPLSAEEARAFADCFGGSPDNYRDCAIQEDPWLKTQPLEVQANITRLVDQAAAPSKQAAASAISYARKASWVAVAALIAIASSIGHFFWLQYRYRQIRPDAYRWVGKVYADRDIAVATMGVEECNKNILKIRECSNLVDRSDATPTQKATAQDRFLDATHYYMGNAAQYAIRIAKTRDAEQRQNTKNIWFDPFSNQPIDVELPSGGGLDMPRVRQMIRLQLRSDYYLPMLEAVAKGKKDPASIPSLEKWGQIAITDGTKKN
jgi:hypothetical protein